MSERVLLVEDDPRLAEMLSEYLGQAGFRISLATLGAAALRQLAESPYDAVVLDLMLPDMDGLDVCRQIRTSSDTPVLMLTARGDAIDRIIGLEPAMTPRNSKVLLVSSVRTRGCYAGCCATFWRTPPATVCRRLKYGLNETPLPPP